MSVQFFQKFRDESSATQFVQRRLWPDGSICPHCGTSKGIGTLRGSSTQHGTYKCYRCRKIFSVRLGTLFESSNVPLHKWLRAIYLCGYDAVTSSRLSTILGVSFKTASFMRDRIHSAAACGALGVADPAADTVCSVRPLLETRMDEFLEAAAGEVQHAREKVIFERFLHAANLEPFDGHAAEFERRFSKVARSRLKLGLWRKARLQFQESGPTNTSRGVRRVNGSHML